MAVHIFTLNEENFEVCFRKGIVGLPEPDENSRKSDDTNDALLSRMACIKENDYILMYITGTKELRGVWQADGQPFYDTAPIWNGKIYPYRCRIKTSPFCFDNPLKLNDINDLRNNNKIWTWELTRPGSGVTNTMFAISNHEFQVLINEYLKINPFSSNQWRIREPYPFHEPNFIERIHRKGSLPAYESSVMACINNGFSLGMYKDIFGNYTDHLCYVPTNLGKEIDVLLMYEHPFEKNTILSYDIIEVKKDKFDLNALRQLIGYESWFLQKKISGDMNMLRTTAVAKRFSEDVIQYVQQRTVLENKPIKLVEYTCNEAGDFILNPILQG